MTQTAVDEAGSVDQAIVRVFVLKIIVIETSLNTQVTYIGKLGLEFRFRVYYMI